jgi:S-DNA-T family DNA segregation ATPase FtsK/SpoIIIE
MAKRKQKSPLDYISLPHLHLNPEVKRSIFVVLIFALAVILFLSLVNAAGTVGPYLEKILIWLAGWGKWAIPIILAMMAFLMFGKDRRNLGALHYIGAITLLWSFAAMLHFFIEPLDWEIALEQGKGGGHIGWALAALVMNLVGFWAGVVILLALFCVGLMLMFNSTLSGLMEKGASPFKFALHPFSFFVRRAKEARLAKQYNE